MKLFLNGGLNLNDPIALEQSECSISLNADYRQDGVVRSRDGKVSIYTSIGTDLIGSANGNIYTYGSYIYDDGTSTGQAISNPVVVGRMHLYNSTTEAQFLSSDANYKCEDSSVTQWGITAPSLAPSTSLTGTGLTGAYSFVYTYVRKSGSSIIAESNPSPSASVSPANQTVRVTPTQPSDTQVTHIRVYRTLVNGTGDDFFYDGEIAVGVTYYDSSQADTALGALVETNNDIPPSGITSIAGPGAFNNLFVGVSNRVYYSKPGRPESFPADYYVEVGTTYFPIQALVDWGGVIYSFNKEGVYALQGTSHDTFYPIKTMASRGLFSKHAYAPSEVGIFYLSYDGLYAFNGQAESKLTSDKVDSLFRGETVNGISPINKSSIDTCWLVYFNGKVMLGYPDSNETTPNKVLVFDFIKKKFSIYDYGVSIKSAYVDEFNQRLLAGDSDGTLWRLEYGEYDVGTTFDFQVRSKELGDIPSLAPSIVRLDVYNEGENTVDFKLLHKESVVHTYSFSDHDEHKRRILPPLSYSSLQIEITSTVDSRVAVGVIELE